MTTGKEWTIWLVNRAGELFSGLVQILENQVSRCRVTCLTLQKYKGTFISRKPIFQGRTSMRNSKRVRPILFGALFAVVVFAEVSAHALASYPPVNNAPDPYQPGQTFGQLPQGRKWGSVSGVSVGPDGNIWALDRCGGSNCKGSSLDPVVEFDPSGKLLRSFGAGLIVAPHGLFVDKRGNVWVTDSQGRQGEGQQIYKFSPGRKGVNEAW